MEKNVGTYDASLRITFGLIGLAYSIVCGVRHRRRFPWLLALMSAMKIAEGIVRFCPTLALFGKDTSKGTTLNTTALINEITD
jgi:hypothetical protein